MKIRNPTATGRSGFLILLVLSVLSMFMMLGALMLVLASRARTTARAFASASGVANRDEVSHRLVLDEALMVLLRGPAAGALGAGESILADRYGAATVSGTLTGLTGAGTLQATLSGTALSGTAPLAFNGRVLTIKPQAGDPAPITSYRIVNLVGSTATLSNLRTVQPFRLRPTQFPCEVFVNGRDFDDTGTNETYDQPGADNPFLTDLRPQGAGVTVAKAAYGGAGPYQVDNDGDGEAEGVWLDGLIPAMPQADGGIRTFRVSYTVLELDGRFNVNAHETPSGTTVAGIGPAAVKDVSGAFNAAVWNRVMRGGTIPPAGPPSSQQRRPTPTLGYDVDGRFGRSGNTDPYGLRLDFNGPRPGSPALEGDRGGLAIGSVFTVAELERVLRPFDPDAAALPPRLAAILADDAQRGRMLVTTDSWDTTGLTGQVAQAFATVSSTTGLPQEIREGRRFDLNRMPLANDTEKQTFFETLLAILDRLGVPAADGAQWAANVVEFRDKDQVSTSFTVPGVAGMTVAGYEPTDATYTALGGNPANERLESIAALLAVPRGSKPELEDPDCPADLKRSLALETPEILDAVAVPSLFGGTVNANPWREPGRVNVNTCDEQVWEALLADASAPGIPASPTESITDLLTDATLSFSDPSRTFQSLRVGRTDRLATIATPRSNVFAVWITVQIQESGSLNATTRHRRMFAVVDRSVPVGYKPGENLNAWDAVRLVRYID